VLTVNIFPFLSFLPILIFFTFPCDFSLFFCTLLLFSKIACLSSFMFISSFATIPSSWFKLSFFIFLVWSLTIFSNVLVMSYCMNLGLVIILGSNSLVLKSNSIFRVLFKSSWSDFYCEISSAIIISIYSCIVHTYFREYFFPSERDINEDW
jgi:hypothetical protein